MVFQENPLIDELAGKLHDRALGILSSGAENRVLEIVYALEGLRDVTTLTPLPRG